MYCHKVLQSRSMLRPNVLVGSFKLDIATVWLQKGNIFVVFSRAEIAL